MRPLLAGLIQRIVVHLDSVDIELLPSRIGAALRDQAPGPSSEGSAESHEQPIVLSVPAQFRRVGLGIRMLIAGADSPGRATKTDPKLIKLIVRSHLLSNRLAESSGEYLADVAQSYGQKLVTA